MEMIITTGKHSYLAETIDATVEVGSTVFVPAEKAWYTVTAPGVLTALLETSEEDSDVSEEEVEEEVTETPDEPTEEEDPVEDPFLV